MKHKLRKWLQPIRPVWHFINARFLGLCMFWYDFRRFVKYAGCYHDSKESCLARIVMAYHIIEKGLTMPNRHLDFGHDAVLNLIRIVEDFIKRYGEGNQQVVHAIGVVREYLEMHEKGSVEFSQHMEFWNIVRTFVKRYQAVEASRQLEYDRAKFYANVNSPFPLFAHSRRTVRHFSGIVSETTIQDAVKLAMTAPSACNRQHVRVHSLSDPGLKVKLLALQSGNRGFGADADKLLLVTADLSDICWPWERNDGFTNAGIFIMNLSYALHYYGVGSCILNWSVSPALDRQMRKIVRVGDSENVVAILAIGMVPEHFMVASSPRRPFGDIFFENTKDSRDAE